MSDDASYTSFLNQANASPNPSTSHSASQSKSNSNPTTTPNPNIPSSLSAIVSNSSHTYTSDTDSTWTPITLPYSSSAPTPLLGFSHSLINNGYGDHVEVIDPLSHDDFDPRGEYKDILDAVRQAGKDGKGEVTIYRAEVGGTRVKYYVMTVAKEGDKLVGVFTEAVES